MQKCAHLVELEKCCQTHILNYFLAKVRFDTAENEPAKNLQNFAKYLQKFEVFENIVQSRGLRGPRRLAARRVQGEQGGVRLSLPRKGRGEPGHS